MACCLALLLGACQPRTPDDLALTVLLEETGQPDDVVMGFIPCVSIDSELAALQVKRAPSGWKIVATLRFEMA